MAFAPDGELYTHTGQRQKLAKYDIVHQTGGSFGIALPTGFPNPFGFAINNEGEAIVVDNYQGFYSVNLSNGAFTTIGSVAGLVLGLMGTRVLSFIVYQATPKDPLVLGGVTVAMLLLGLIASWIPARRALAVDPLVLLREE